MLRVLNQWAPLPLRLMLGIGLVLLGIDIFCQGDEHSNLVDSLQQNRAPLATGWIVVYGVLLLIAAVARLYKLRTIPGVMLLVLGLLIAIAPLVSVWSAPAGSVWIYVIGGLMLLVGLTTLMGSWIWPLLLTIVLGIIIALLGTAWIAPEASVWILFFGVLLAISGAAKLLDHPCVSNSLFVLLAITLVLAPLGATWDHVLGVLVVLGAVSLFLGYQTSQVAFPLLAGGIGAFVLAATQGGFLASWPGCEMGAWYLAGLAALMFGGAGTLSIDRWLENRRDQRLGWRLLLSEEYRGASDEEQRAMLWDVHLKSRYKTLPEITFSWIAMAIRMVNIPWMDSPFEVDSDVRPPRAKVFHASGVLAQVRFKPAEGHPFTGLFEDEAVGVARLSLSMRPMLFITGIGLKLFVSGRRSLNTLLNPAMDPQDTTDFFQHGSTNRLPAPTHLPFGPFWFIGKWWFALMSNPLDQPVDQFAKFKADGTPVDANDVVAPYQLFVEPEIHTNPRSQQDYRVELARIPAGTVLYKVYATRSKWEAKIYIGELVSESWFVASEFSDRVLSFFHIRLPVIKE